VSDQDRRDLARRILGGGPPRIDPATHFDGCPAREGKPICSCGGSMRSTPESKAFTERVLAESKNDHAAAIATRDRRIAELEKVLRELLKECSDFGGPLIATYEAAHAALRGGEKP
jgi:hypothetical protein